MKLTISREKLSYLVFHFCPYSPRFQKEKATKKTISISSTLECFLLKLRQHFFLRLD
ncbi:hypothetical protein HanRHA438_Chr13g0584621 [Helianthus annuus]|nr:hypothetical protein HanRHA438_Chr13g0584621 [Helianthus annuus]